MTKAARIAILLSTAILSLASAGVARAATVTNGGFETGTLEGWQTASQNENGGWSVVSATEAEEETEGFAPFERSYEAIFTQEDASSAVLYRDVPLEAGDTHELSLEFSYHSFAPISIPDPDTLNVEGPTKRAPKNSPTSRSGSTS